MDQGGEQLLQSFDPGLRHGWTELLEALLVWKGIILDVVIFFLRLLLVLLAIKVDHLVLLLLFLWQRWRLWAAFGPVLFPQWRAFAGGLFLLDFFLFLLTTFHPRYRCAFLGDFFWWRHHFFCERILVGVWEWLLFLVGLEGLGRAFFLFDWTGDAWWLFHLARISIVNLCTLLLTLDL